MPKFVELSKLRPIFQLHRGLGLLGNLDSALLRWISTNEKQQRSCTHWTNELRRNSERQDANTVGIFLPLEKKENSALGARLSSWQIVKQKQGKYQHSVKGMICQLNSEISCR